MTHSLFIDGGAGTTGLEIADRIAGRGEFALITLDDAARKDSARRAEALNDADFAILCLPDDAAREAAALITNPRVRVIDASSAHRVTPGWTYGFAELSPDQRGQIAAAPRVTNPGCYATGFVALVAPLVQRGIIRHDTRLSCYGVSGYSGGGKALIARYEADPALAWRSYALTLGHKHAPEMRHRCGLTHAPLFAPAVVPAFRGMMVDVPLMFDAPMAARVGDALTEHYAGSPLVSVTVGAGDIEDGELLLRADALPSDRLDLFVLPDADGTAMRLVARLDNLGKGASGACVQNLNIMAGIAETAGLRL